MERAGAILLGQTNSPVMGFRGTCNNYLFGPSRNPFSLDEQVDFLAAIRRPIEGLKIAYSPNFDVFPVDSRVAEVVGNAVTAFEEAGAHVEEERVGIQRHQRELSDLWCRLMTPINVATLEGFKHQGIDLPKDHQDDFPPQYLDWVEKGYEMSALALFRDQELRTEVYDAIQRVFTRYDLLITPTLRVLRWIMRMMVIRWDPAQLMGKK